MRLKAVSLTSCLRGPTSLTIFAPVSLSLGTYKELADLSHLTRRERPCLIVVYGRRHVGKSTLIRHWANQSGLPFFYWESPRQNDDKVRASLVRELLIWAGESPTVADDRSVSGDWATVFRLMRRVFGTRPTIAAFDEFPWAVEANTGLPSLLKTAWDNVLADTQLKLLIAGSHISAMEKLLHSDAALFGRFEGKLQVHPFPFTKITPFVSRYSPEKRLAVYAILGGVPDYLRRWDDGQDLMPNIRDIFLSDLSPYRNEHQVLISDLLRRDSPDYESVLSAVAKGKHELKDITLESGTGTTARASGVLTILEEARLSEKRIRASVKPKDQADARYARYHLADPFLQFYYRFVEPNRSRVAQGLYDELEPIFRTQLRGFVGYAFEALCRHWALIKARNSEFPFSPEFIGSDWGAGTQGYQADVVAINWTTRKVFIGEAKWAEDDMDNRRWRDFEDSVKGVMSRLQSIDARDDAKRSPQPLDSPIKQPWKLHQAVFVRRGVTATVQAAAHAVGAQIMTFEEIVADLEQLPEKPLR